MKEVTGLFAIVPETLLQNDELTANEKIVVTALLLHRNQKNGACYPGIARIGKLASLSRMTVLRVLDSLEKKGVIERKRRFTDFGDYDTNAYSMGGWYQGDTTPYHDDTTPYQGDTTVVSGRDYGWYQADTLTKNLNKEKEQKKPSAQSLPLEPKPKPRRNVHGERIKAAFEEFWQLYPKRQGKKAAFEAFSGLLPALLGPDRLNQRFQNICGQATLYAESVRGTEQKYIKNPVNWLRECDPDEAAIIEEETWVRAEGDE
ncbi:hypothetical protein SDC9_62700 [bioreactor metagenome]|uniref:Helix-turn-helix domain-containing protein n=1 Tax=bioreactor metagenome TaxID=1076179 RepID=A0A644XJE9_9ZZZZ